MIDHEQILEEYCGTELQLMRHAVDNNKDAFIATYSKAKELYPYKSISPMFYNRKETSGDLGEWRIKTVAGMIEDKYQTLLNAGSGYTGQLERAIIEKSPSTEIDSIDTLPEETFDGPVEAYYHCQSIDKIGFPDNAFDVVVCMEVMEHIPPTMTMKVWSELARVLKKGGTMIISTPCTEKLQNHTMFCPCCQHWVTENGHVRLNHPPTIVMEMKIAGIENVEIVSGTNLMFVYKGIKS